MAMNIPLDIGPRSKSSSFSGFNWDMIPEDMRSSIFSNRPVQSVMDENKPAFGMLGKEFGAARQSLPQMYQNTLKPELQQQLNKMAGRGIVNSSVTGSALGKAGADVSNWILGQDFGSRSNEANAKSNLLSQVLGQDVSRQGMMAGLMPTIGGYSKSESESADTSVPYRMILDLFRGR